MRRINGFTLVDVVVGVALLVIVFVALSGTLRAALAVSALARAKGAMSGLAESQMEYLRGLSYNALGTVAGVPDGVVTEDATSTVDDIGYDVRTTIIYGDAGQDYKQAEVTVTAYGTRAHSLSLVSTFAP
jgi:type II secretory pathway pseudopilin PulG